MTLRTSIGSQQVARFSTGDRVRVVENYPGMMEISGRTATVERVKELSTGKVAVWVRWDNPGTYAATWRLPEDFLRPLVPQPIPPRFDTVEQADRWLEQNALRSESCSL